jgi:hypothetical protein
MKSTNQVGAGGQHRVRCGNTRCESAEEAHP